MLFRRHTTDCNLGQKHGRAYRECSCPVWVDETTPAGRRLRSLQTNDWRTAEELARLGTLPTLSETYTKWFREVKRQGLAARTIIKYDGIVCLFLNMCHLNGIEYLHQVEPETVERFIADFKAAATQEKALSVVKLFFDSCGAYKNPAKTVKPPKTGKPKKNIVPFTKDQIAKILENLQGELEYFAMASLLLSTGMRISDAVNLKAEEYQEGYVTKRAQKNGVSLRLKLPDILCQYIEIHIKRSDPIFSLSMRQFQRRFKVAFEAAGCPQASLHWFRHTFATRLLSVGATVREVADTLGISERVAFETYCHWVPERVQRIEALIRKL